MHTKLLCQFFSSRKDQDKWAEFQKQRVSTIKNLEDNIDVLNKQHVQTIQNHFVNPEILKRGLYKLLMDKQ